jgi:DNA-binding CsgD family transcriptional regulator
MAVAQALDDPGAIAYAHLCLMNVAWINGDTNAMQMHAAEGLALFEAVGDDWGRAGHLIGVGVAAMESGDIAAARNRLTESIDLYEGLGDRWTSAVPLFYLGWVELREGNLDRAQSLFEQSLALRRDGANTNDIPYVLYALVVTTRLQGDFNRMVVLCRECLSLCQDTGWVQGTAWCLAEFAVMLAAAGEPERAARAFGGAEALRNASAVPLAGADRIDYGIEIERVRTQLGPAAFAAAWQAGQTAPIDDVIAETLAAVSVDTRPVTDLSDNASLAGLSPREREVLRLIAAGMSTREIAEILVISEGTVGRHVTNVYRKIGAKNRADATAYAFRQRLASS